MMLTTAHRNKLQSVSQSLCDAVYVCVVTDQRVYGGAPTLGLFTNDNQKQFEMFGAARDAVSLGESVDDRAVFQSLVRQWHEERGATSSVAKMVACRSYGIIISMGRPRAVELILAQMESEGTDPDHWFWALQILTGANPVSEEDEGNLQAMAKAWLNWGRKSGYAW